MVNIEKTSISRRKGEQGFTLIEMVISIMLFLMVTGMIWGALSISRQSKVMVNQEVELSKTMRVGLNLIGRDTYNAGLGIPLPPSVVRLPNNRLITLLGIADDGDATRDLALPIISGNALHTNNLNPVAATRTDQVTFFYKDSSFNLIGPDAARSVSMSVSIHPVGTVDGIDEIVPITSSNSVASVNDLYLVRGNTSATLVVATGTRDADKIQFADTDILNFNQSGAGGPLYGVPVPASLQKVSMVTYFVTQEGVLTRRRYANIPVQTPQPQFIDDPLVYGVEDFQIRYVLDTGAVVDAPTAGELDNIRQIRYTISVKSWETDAQGNPYRTSMTSTYSTRNLGY